MPGLDDNVDDHKPDRIASREKIYNDDKLNDRYCKTSSSKELWEAIEKKKYGKKLEIKSTLLENTNFKMVEGKFVCEFAYEVHNLVVKIKAKRILIDKRLQVLSLIDKFHLS